MSTTTDLTELKINVLTQAQYDSATKASDELYLTPAMEDVSSQFTFGGAWTALLKKAYKVGNLVFFQLEATTSTYVANTDYTIATIASGYRPNGNIIGNGYTTDANYAPKAVVSVRGDSGGNIKVNASNTTGAYFFLTGWYVIA